MDDFIGLVGHATFMGNYHYGLPFCIKLPEKLHDLHRGFAVQGTGGFVGQDNLWVGNQRPCYGNTLFLPARQFVGHVHGPFLQSQSFQIFHG